MNASFFLLALSFFAHRGLHAEETVSERLKKAETLMKSDSDSMEYSDYIGNQSKAKAIIDQILTELPENRDAQILKGESVLILGDKEAAIKRFDSILQKNPENVTALALRAKAKYSAQTQKVDRSEEVVDDITSGLQALVKKWSDDLNGTVLKINFKQSDEEDSIDKNSIAFSDLVKIRILETFSTQKNYLKTLAKHEPDLERQIRSSVLMMSILGTILITASPSTPPSSLQIAGDRVLQSAMKIVEAHFDYVKSSGDYNDLTDCFSIYFNFYFDLKKRLDVQMAALSYSGDTILSLKRYRDDALSKAESSMQRANLLQSLWEKRKQTNSKVEVKQHSHL